MVQCGIVLRLAGNASIDLKGTEASLAVPAAQGPTINRKAHLDSEEVLTIRAITVGQTGKTETLLVGLMASPPGSPNLVAVCEGENRFSLRIISEETLLRATENDDSIAFRDIVPDRVVGTIDVAEDIVRKILTGAVHDLTETSGIDGCVAALLQQCAQRSLAVSTVD